MNALSIFIIVVAVASFIFGYNRGIVREASSLCAILLGIVACRLFGDTATALAAAAMGVTDDGASAMSHYTAAIVGNGALFAAVWLGIYMLARMIRGAVHAVRLGIIDRIAGALFCMAKWMLALSLVLNIIYLVAPTAAMWGADPPVGLIKAALEFAPWMFGALTAQAV